MADAVVLKLIPDLDFEISGFDHDINKVWKLHPLRSGDGGRQ